MASVQDKKEQDDMRNEFQARITDVTDEIIIHVVFDGDVEGSPTRIWANESRRI